MNKLQKFTLLFVSTTITSLVATTISMLVIGFYGVFFISIMIIPILSSVTNVFDRFIQDKSPHGTMPKGFDKQDLGSVS